MTGKLFNVCCYLDPRSLEDGGLAPLQLNQDQAAYQRMWSIVLDTHHVMRQPFTRYEIGLLVPTESYHDRYSQAESLSLMDNAKSGVAFPPYLPYELFMARKLDITIVAEAPGFHQVQSIILPREVPSITKVFQKVQMGRLIPHASGFRREEDLSYPGYGETMKYLAKFIIDRLPIAVTRYPEGNIPFILPEDLGDPRVGERTLPGEVTRDTRPASTMDIVRR